MAQMQSRADPAYMAAGRRAPPPLPLERPREYRIRLLDGLKMYSPNWESADLSTLKDDALGVIEPAIFGDAFRFVQGIGSGGNEAVKPRPARRRFAFHSFSEAEIKLWLIVRSP